VNFDVLDFVDIIKFRHTDYNWTEYASLL